MGRRRHGAWRRTKVSAAEERATRAERELAMYMQSDNSLHTNRDKGVGTNKAVSFVGENEIALYTSFIRASAESRRCRVF